MFSCLNQLPTLKFRKRRPLQLHPRTRRIQKGEKQLGCVLVLINRWHCAVTELGRFTTKKEWACALWGGEKRWFSTTTICDNLERDIKGNPAVCFSVSAIYRPHHPEHSELFMPVLILGPRSGLHCHSDPHSTWECRWHSRGRQKIAWTQLVMQINTHTKSIWRCLVEDVNLCAGIKKCLLLFIYLVCECVKETNISHSTKIICCRQLHAVILNNFN